MLLQVLGKKSRSAAPVNRTYLQLGVRAGGSHAPGGERAEVGRGLALSLVTGCCRGGTYLRILAFVAQVFMLPRSSCCRVPSPVGATRGARCTALVANITDISLGVIMIFGLGRVCRRSRARSPWAELDDLVWPSLASRGA